MEVSYIRVSSIMQNEARQMEAMKGKNIEKYFIEKISAKDTNRPKLQEMLEFVREGDIVHIHDFSRLARSTPTGKLMLTMIGAINEFERQNLLERQREGIEIAKREKKFKGGQEKKVDESEFEKALQEYKERKLNKTGFAVRIKVSRPTLNKILQERGIE